jgi:hypothetical protein
VLKEGCRVERLQLSDTDRLQTALAPYMVIAWCIDRLVRLGALCPIYRQTYCSSPTNGERRLS